MALGTFNLLPGWEIESKHLKDDKESLLKPFTLRQELSIEIGLVNPKEVVRLQVLKVDHGKHIVDSLKFLHILLWMNDAAEKRIRLAFLSLLE